VSCCGVRNDKSNSFDIDLHLVKVINIPCITLIGQDTTGFECNMCTQPIVCMMNMF